MNFIERKISAKKAISILAKYGIKVEDYEADIILDFLYLWQRTIGKVIG